MAEHEGLGLGLTIARHLVERHGGQIYADSRGEGQGATFTVHLPLEAAAKLTAPEDEQLDSASFHIQSCPGR